MSTPYTEEEMTKMCIEHPELIRFVLKWVKEPEPVFYTSVHMRTMFVHHPELLEEARELFKENERARRQKRKKEIEEARKLREEMPPEEKIEFLNTPYEKMREDLRAGMTKNPTKFNFMHIEYPNLGPQQETAGARLVRFRDKYDLSREDFRNICNVFAKPFDIRGPRGLQRTRLTKHDVLNYEDLNVSPKTDKLAVMTRAMGMPLAYFTGYGNPDGPISSNEAIASRYRKKRNKDNGDETAPVVQ